MSFEHYIRKGNKRLRYGYTTGTCAALAAACAVRMLLGEPDVRSAGLTTPKGIDVDVMVDDAGVERDSLGNIESAWAGISKDGGDDTDITDGLLICARVKKIDEASGCVLIEGGKGIGTVTKAGLDQPIGSAAINSGPRKMIEEQVKKVCDEMSYDGGIQVVIYAPAGEEAALKTFNSGLGIEGGISILGTTGIVEPMSEQALVDTIELEMKQDGLETECLILTPGNYGTHYIEENGLDRLKDPEGRKIPVLKFSNFLGDTLDMLLSNGIRKVLLVAHAGKLVKVAGGIMNTHSSWADCRREIICAHSALCGGDEKLAAGIMEAATTDACFDILEERGILDRVISSILDSIQEHLEKRVDDEIQIGALMFSNVRGTLGMSPRAQKILHEWIQEPQIVNLTEKGTER